MEALAFEVARGLDGLPADSRRPFVLFWRGGLDLDWLVGLDAITHATTH